MAVRAVRGATSVEADDRDEILDAVGELVAEMLRVNSLDPEAVISMILTSTPDLVSVFPATGARLAGLHDVPLLSAQEVAVEGSTPRVVRVMAHVETDRSRHEIVHVYLRGTHGLRQAAETE